MLYVFRMDLGQMLTVDMSFLMDTVSRLQLEITRMTGIPTEKQILLVSGGHSLKPDQKVMSYGAGADTNPVFLFSRMAIESHEPPMIRAAITKDVLSVLKDLLNRVMSMPPQIECVSTGTKIACQIRDSALRILSFCKNEFKEQHLQYQGWGTVVANLEEIASALHHSKTKFSKVVATFLPMRDQYFAMLDNFTEVMDLLQRIPLLRGLQDEKGSQAELAAATISAVGRGRGGVLPFSRSVGSYHGSFITSTSFTPSTLLEWITMQGQGRSLESLQHKCYEDLHMFNHEMFERLNQQVEQILREVTYDPNHHKELVGIERRLSDLEKRYNEAMKIAEDQNDVTQNFFLKHASNLSKTSDVASLLPDLCQAHKQQLRQMVERQNRIEALQTNFLKSKQEMCTNIHQRLSWVMHVETSISRLDNDLVFHMKTMKILECNLELLSQVKIAPKVYSDIVVEVARRRNFSRKFCQWAESLAEDSTHMYKSEIERRKTFSKAIGDHFLLDTLFRGLDEMPPSFATKAPGPFDCNLPEITAEDMEQLWNSAPELKQYPRETFEASSFPSSFPSKERTDSPFAHIMFPTSQSSQTEWLEQPSVVKATEAPPTMFTLPELQESKVARDLPQVSASQPSSAISISRVIESRAGERIMTDLSPPYSSVALASSPIRASVTSSVVSIAAPRSPSVAIVGLPGKSSRPLATSPTDRGDHHQQQTRMGASPPHTESTSPPSSNEFATADFYFEDSMPSPLASSSERQREDGSSSCSVAGGVGKADGEGKPGLTVASLQAELASRETLIRELEERLKEQGLHPSSRPSHFLPPVSHPHPQQQTSEDNLGCSAVPSLTLSEGGSTPPMEDALDTSLVLGIGSVNKHDSSGLAEQLEQLNSDLAKAKVELLQSERLRQDLEQANTNLAKAKDNLLESEIALGESEEASKRHLQEKDRLVQKLRAELDGVKAELGQSKSDMALREKEVALLNEEAQTSRVKAEELKSEVEAGKGSLRQVKIKLLVVRDSLMRDLSPLKQHLEELRLSVASNRAEFQASVASTLSSVEREVTRLSSQAELSAQCERDGLQTEIQTLKALLRAAESSTAEQAVHVKSIKEDYGAQLVRQEEEAAQRLKDARAEFETALKDQATKHALELELELDRCGAELKDREDALARQAEDLSELRDRLAREVREANLAAEEERESLALAYSKNLRQAEECNAAEMKEAERRLRLEFEAVVEKKDLEVDGRLQELKRDSEAKQLEMEKGKEEALSSLREQLEKEHDDATSDLRQQLEQEQETALSNLRDQLGREEEATLSALKQELSEEHEEALTGMRERLEKDHETAQADLKTQIVELKESLAQTLEQTQLDHANKLTQLKADFDQERDALQAELAGYRDRPRADSSTEPDLEIVNSHLAFTHTQTEGGEEEDDSSLEARAAGKLASSETQTEINLLAEVISLNSSVSFDSEEIKMAASPAIGEDNENKAACTEVASPSAVGTESSPSAQEKIDDLNLQLACAQEKIASLNEEIRTLNDKVKGTTSHPSPLYADLSPLSPCMAEGDATAKPGDKPEGRMAYQDLMTCSSTAASFILMDREQPAAAENTPADSQVIKSKDQKIEQLEKKLKDMASDKVSIRGCDKFDIVLLCLDESHDQYVVFTVGTYLHFLHSESLEVLGLKSGGESRCKKSWILAEVVEKEFCLAKKPNNRFRVPQGTCFYRVKCKPWKSDSDQSPMSARPVHVKQLGSSGKHGSRSKKSKESS